MEFDVVGGARIVDCSKSRVKRGQELDSYDDAAADDDIAPRTPPQHVEKGLENRVLVGLLATDRKIRRVGGGEFPTRINVAAVPGVPAHAVEEKKQI